MAALFCLLLLLIAVEVFWDVVFFSLYNLFPDTVQSLLERWGWLGAIFLGYASWLATVALLIVWLALMGLALAGSLWPMPLLKALSRKTWIIRCSFFGNALAWLLLPFIVGFALYATSLTQWSHKGAAVYFLYDEGIPVPRWCYAMGLSRIALQAEKNWGRHCTVLDRLTKETLRTALASGKVVILATHGEYGYASTIMVYPTLVVGPPPRGATDELGRRRYLQAWTLPYNRERIRLKEGKWRQWENVPANDRLQLVYLFACNGGKKATEWEEHLAPAHVISYNRVSAVWDHALWFALTGPPQVKGLK